ncbi:MAG TPA: hypothetical protein VMU64_04415 [Acidimicrobiales bacterium]|nr:hypothetical protein [Acidimicrobiales bacterium]
MHPVLLAALAAQRQDELRQAAQRTRRGGARRGLPKRQLAVGRRVRRSLGWVLVEVGLRWVVDDTLRLERSPS